jgi:protein SCO1
MLTTNCQHQSAQKNGAPPDQRPEPTGGVPAGVQTVTYQGAGVVRSINPKFPSVEIDHQEIKGLMPAMRMEFYVRDKSLLDGLKPGDRVEFTLENGVGGLKITALKRL